MHRCKRTGDKDFNEGGAQKLQGDHGQEGRRSRRNVEEGGGISYRYIHVNLRKVFGIGREVIEHFQVRVASLVAIILIVVCRVHQARKRQH